MINGSALDNNDKIWFSTSGGVMAYNRLSGAFDEYRNIGALSSLSSSAIAFHKKTGEVFVGSAAGDVDILSSTGEWSKITDIRYANNIPNKKINKFLFLENNFFIAGEFGLIEYNYQNLPGDYIERFGNFPPKTGVKKIVILGDTLFVATASGIAKADRNSTSLRNPLSWSVVTADNGLLNSVCLDIIVSGDSLIILHPNGISSYKNSTASVLKRNLTGVSAPRSIVTYNNQPVYMDVFSAVSLSTGDVIWQSASGEVQSLLSCSEDVAVVTYVTGGFTFIDDLEKTLIFPQTPSTNLFLSLGVDTRGAVWASGDIDRNYGTSALKDELWTNYTTKNTPSLKHGAIYKVSPQKNGEVYFGTWGGGTIVGQYANGEYTFQQLDTSNSPLRGIASAVAFICTGASSSDRNGAVWMPNWGGNSAGPVLVARNSDGSMRGYESRLQNQSRSFHIVAVDAHGTKWMASNNRAENGLAYFNENNTPDNLEDDMWGVLTTSNSALGENFQTSLIVDKNNVLWIGTSVGLFAIYNTSPILRNGKVTVTKSNVLTNQIIYDIAVDAANNKWIATSNGVFVINDDGTETVGTINSKEYPLVSDDVRAIAIDNTTGRVYFGTEFGLSAAYSPIAQPLPTYNIRVYPQPFNPNVDNEIIIDGLAENTQLHILALDGRRIRSLNTQSRKAIWDGRDDRGAMVQTGVYIINALSASQTESSVGKIAVKRE